MDAARFSVAYWRRFFATGMADYFFGAMLDPCPVRCAKSLAICLTLLEKTGVEAPALHQLYQAIEIYAMRGRV